MRYSILGFKQEELIKYDIDMTDVLLLDYIQKALAQPSMVRKVENGQVYVWLKHSKILSDLPILHIKKDMLNKRISKLVKLNLIKSIQISNESHRGTKAYYTITELVESMQFDTSRPNVLDYINNDEPNVLDYIKNTESNVLDYTSNNILYNNDNILNSDNKELISDEISTNTNTSSNNTSSLELKHDVYLEEDKNTYNENTQFRLSNGKIINKTTKSPKYIAEYINQMKASDDVNKNNKFKTVLLNWYYNIGVGITSILQLERKLDRIFNDYKGDLDKVIESIDNAYINGWKAFYTTKSYSRKKTVAEMDKEHNLTGCDFLFEHGRHFDPEVDGARNNGGELITF